MNVMPPVSMPSDAASTRTASSVDPWLRNTAGSPARTPADRKCRPRAVFPTPGPPRTRYTRPARNPPYRTSSRPSTPELTLPTPELCQMWDASALALCRRHAPVRGGALVDLLARVRGVHAGRARGVALERGAGADRARHEVPAAVRTDVMEHGLGAVDAPRALVCADPRIRRGRRQVAVAELAVGTQLEHQKVSAP